MEVEIKGDGAILLYFFTFYFYFFFNVPLLINSVEKVRGFFFFFTDNDNFKKNVSVYKGWTK